MPESNRITETRDVSGFDRVSLDGVGVLVITQGSEERLSIEADEQVMPRITTRVDDGALHIGLESGSWWQRLTDAVRRVRYELVMEDVAGIRLSGAGTIEASSVSTDRLDLDVSGAGKLRLDGLSGTSLTVVVSGAGSCEVSGRVEDQEVRISGAGGYKSPDLRSSCAKAVLSGTGSITIRAEDTLDATISGAGSIKYHGEPTVFQRITGVGTIRSLD